MGKTNQELVYDVCDKLSSEGKDISVQKVLDLIPSIKSKSTVHPHVKSWRADKHRRVTTQKESVILSKVVYSALADEVLRHIKLTNEEWCERLVEATAHRDEAIDDLKQIEDKYQHSESRREELDILLIEQVARSEVKMNFWQDTLKKEKLANEMLASRNQELQAVAERTRIELAKAQGGLEAQEAKTLSYKKVNNELELRIHLLEEKLRNKDKQQASTRLRERNRK
ncbi:DNA-binding protein [Vibrio breoganii]